MTEIIKSVTLQLSFFCSGAVLCTFGYGLVVLCAENEYWSESIPGYC